MEKARAEYVQARRWFETLVLRYYVVDSDATAVGYTRDKLAELPPEQVHDLMDKFMKRVETVYKTVDNLPHAEDVREYRENLQRIEDRLNLLK